MAFLRSAILSLESVQTENREDRAANICICRAPISACDSKAALHDGGSDPFYFLKIGSRMFEFDYTRPDQVSDGCFARFCPISGFEHL